MKKIFKIFMSAIITATTAFSVLAPALYNNTPITADAAFAVDGKGNEAYWADNIAEPTNYSHSFVVVGDTQYVTMYDNRVRGNPSKYANEQVRLGYFSSASDLKKDNLKTLYKWLADNAESKKIKHVLGVGDITHTDSEGEWKVAHEAISQLNGVIPYSLVRGNHDNRKTFYDYYFSGVAPDTSNAYMDQVIDYYAGYGEEYRARNTAHVFSGGNVDYLVISLDFGAEDEVLDWANQVVEAHPNHTVIVTTHAYQKDTGERLGLGHYEAPSRYQPTYITDYGYPPNTQFNDGTDMWNEFISKHENISIVFSGHVLNARLVYEEDIGVHGNVVQQIMVNPQSIDDDDKLPQDNFYGTPIQKSLTGMVAIFYCNADGTLADVQWYSTLKNKWYVGKNNENLIRFETNAVEKDETAHLRVRATGEAVITPTYQQLNGEPTTISITASEYFRFNKLLYNGKNISDQLTKNGDTYTYTLNATTGYHYFVADIVEENRYALVEQNDLWKGRISYTATGANATYENGTTLLFSVTPNEGYTVKKVTYNGEELTADNTGKYQITITARENVLKVEYIDPIVIPDPPTGDSSSSDETGDSVSSGGGTAPSGCNASLPVGIGGTAVCAALSILLKKRRKKDDVI